MLHAPEFAYLAQISECRFPNLTSVSGVFALRVDPVFNRIHI